MTDVHFQARDGSCMRVIVADATRAVLSVTKGADTGAMTTFSSLAEEDGPTRMLEISNTFWKFFVEPTASTLSTRQVFVSWM